jgi:CelD/BcsL family acetyltransferase involved in cellulose biosynthesis
LHFDAHSWRAFSGDPARLGGYNIGGMRVQQSGRESAIQAQQPCKTILTTRILQASELPGVLEQWSELSGAALVPNPFYEPWIIQPAVEHIANGESLRFLAVFGPSRKTGEEPLWGFFPLEIQPKWLKLPIRTLSFWQHRYCFLATPLVHADHVWEVLDTFWRWFERNPFGCRFLDTRQLLAEGPFQAVWTDFAIGRSSFMVREFPRAFLEPSEPADVYLARTIKKKHYDEFLRLRRRLAEQGCLETRQVESVAELDPWIEDFLRLELSGWKGSPDGGAFAKEAEDTAFFREVTRAGFLQKRVMLLSLVLDGQPIAMKYNILAGDGGFTFKIAFDERYSKYSPGVLLELDNICRVCEDPDIKWLDSCASPRHIMANRIWRERRMIRRTLFSNGSRWSDFVIAALPLLQWAYTLVNPEQTPAYRVSTKGG